MAVKFANHASALLATPIGLDDTEIAVQFGFGSRFPSLSAGDWYPLVLIDAAGNHEIMRATGRTGDVITVLRGREGTAPHSFAAGARAALRLTRAAIDAIYEELRAEHDADIARLEGKLDAPLGTRLAFFQSVPPPGWEVDAQYNECAIRLMGAGDVEIAGVVNFSTVFSRTATDERTLLRANLPAITLEGVSGWPSAAMNHGHGYFYPNWGTVFLQAGPHPQRTIGSDLHLQTDPVELNHYHDVSVPLGGSYTPFNMPIDLRVKYATAKVAVRTDPA